MATRFVHGAEILSAIREGQKRPGPKALAVAYWGSDAASRLGLHGSAADGSLRDLRVICDPWGGFCDPTSLRALLDAGAEVGTIPEFHAKTYLFPGQVIVGSANASRRGLGDPESDAAPPRMETAVVSDEPDMVAAATAWFEETWKEARPLDRTMLPAITALRNGTRLRNPGRPSLLYAIAHEQQILEGMDVWVTAYPDQDAPGLQEVWDATKADHYTASEIETYDATYRPCYIDTLYNSTSYEKGRIYIDYAKNARGRPIFYGIWQVKGAPPIPMPGGDQHVYLLDELPNLVGYVAKPAEMKAFGQALQTILTQETESLRISDERIINVARSVLESAPFADSEDDASALSGVRRARRPNPDFQ